MKVLSNISTKARRIYMAAFVGGAPIMMLLLVIGWNDLKSTATEKAAPAAATPVATSRPIEVSTAQAITDQVPIFIRATGSFAADETSDLASEISGQVVATPINVGAFVMQGAIIARLNDRDAQLRLQQAQADEQQAQAAVREAEARLGWQSGPNFDPTSVADVRAARSSLESAEADAKLAESDARRYADLVEQGVVSRSLFDQARTKAETARAQASAARQRYEVALNTARQSHQGIESAQAALEKARVQVAMAQKAVNDTIIRAPISGYVSDRPIAIGEYVTPASKIATILRTSPIKLLLQVPEADVARIGRGMRVSASVDGYAGREFVGQVTAINPAISSSSRAITVEAHFDNTENLLRAGMFATARIIQPTSEPAVFAPHTAVLSDPNTNSTRVFVIEGATARLRVVQVGEEKGDLARILSGVSSGEVLATTNLDQLYEGAPVQLK